MVLVILKALHRTYDELDSKFYSDDGSFKVTLYNLNYRQTIEKKQAFKNEKTGLKAEKQAFESLPMGLEVSTPTRENILKPFLHFGFGNAFARADVMIVLKTNILCRLCNQ